jgi:hypothetical protein
LHATLEIIGVNPYLDLPDNVPEFIFRQCGKSRGAIPVKGVLNGKEFRQSHVN